MKYLLAILAPVLLSACTTVPVTASFPESPKFAAQACPDLLLLQQGAQLSDVAATVNINYTTYYQCAVKVDAWREWYQVQKNIFEKAGK